MGGVDVPEEQSDDEAADAEVDEVLDALANLVPVERDEDVAAASRGARGAPTICSGGTSGSGRSARARSRVIVAGRPSP